jgi:hypothetical protein
MKSNAWYTGKLGVFLAGIVLLVPTQGKAGHEPFGLYESWDNPTIQSRRWRGSEIFGGQEVKREVENGKLRMRFRREGETGSDVGTNFSSNLLNVTNPTSVDQMEAEFTVSNVTVTGCEANPAPSTAGAAGVVLARFNDGSSSGPGDRTGDYFALIQAQRNSIFGPPGALSIATNLLRCDDPGCFAISLPPFGILGTVEVGASFRLRIIWDSTNNQFVFGLDDNPDEVLSYDPKINAQPAAVPFGSIQIGHRTANCAVGPTVADAETEVGQVRTNISAIVP